MSKQIVCADALIWLADHKHEGAVITSPPDAAEIGLSIAKWATWYTDAIRLCARATHPEAPLIVYPTDRKAEGAWHSKAAIIHSVAYDEGLRCLWHKIVLRRSVNASDLHRPTYSHLIAFSKNARPGKASPDVIERGKMIYPNAMGLIPAQLAVSFVGDKSRTIIDPFCGRGTVPAVAEALGYNAIGVDIDPEQCKLAEKLKLGRKPQRLNLIESAA